MIGNNQISLFCSHSNVGRLNKNDLWIDCISVRFIVVCSFAWKNTNGANASNPHSSVSSPSPALLISLPKTEVTARTRRWNFRLMYSRDEKANRRGNNSGGFLTARSRALINQRGHRVFVDGQSGGVHVGGLYLVLRWRFQWIILGQEFVPNKILLPLGNYPTCLLTTTL